MNSLPDQAQTGGSKSVSQQPSAPTPPPQGAGAPLGMKEIEVGITSATPERVSLTDIGKDIDLPKEVVDAGVRAVPTHIAVPPNMQKRGVQPAGNNVTVGSGRSVTLPLTGNQIQEGLKKDTSSSWRWLAEWCIRKVKQLQMIFAVKTGKD